jgi:hypothetical protein
MRAILSLFVMTAMLVACGQPTTSAGPSTATGPGTSPSPIAAPIAGASDAFVVTLPEIDGVYTRALQVDAVGPDGTIRPVATISDVTAGLPSGTTILDTESILLSPRGFLTIEVLGSFDGVAVDAVDRRLIFDLRAPGDPPRVVPAGYAFWGPDGTLAVIGAPGVTYVDPTSGHLVQVPTTADLETATVWAADGSGLLASRHEANDTSTPGVLTTDGSFVEGVQVPYSTIGLGRPYGADGTLVSDATSDGPTGSEQVILEERKAAVGNRAWLIVHQPGSDPSIDDHAWDAAGTGQWVVLDRDGTVRLVHISAPTATGPETPEEHACLTLPHGATIVGVAADDGAVILATGDLHTPAAALLRVDTKTGVAVRIDRGGGASTFAGWAAVR